MLTSMARSALIVTMDVSNVMLSKDVFHVVDNLLEVTVNYVNRDSLETTAVR